MGIFSRIFKIGQSEAHSALDKLEDPIKMTEQGIRDLKKDLDKSLQALAEVKAAAIRSKREHEQAKHMSSDYENKAILLIQKAEKGELDVNEADRLASEALNRKESSDQEFERTKAEIEMFDKNIAQLDANVKKLRATISKYENELRTLKARDRVSKASAKINKSMSNIDSNSTVSMLEKMKDKVNQQEAVAEAYSDIANENKSLDDELDEALSDKSGADKLSELKARLRK